VVVAMPLALIALSKVDDKDAGLACSLVNTGRMAGGSIGLAILGTVAWSVLASTSRSSANARRTCCEHPPPDGPMHLSDSAMRPAMNAGPARRSR
jgi:hypothetical protein